MIVDNFVFNRYSYVRNNPLKYTDPSGYFVWPWKKWKNVPMFVSDDSWLKQQREPRLSRAGGDGNNADDGYRVREYREELRGPTGAISGIPGGETCIKSHFNFGLDDPPLKGVQLKKGSGLNRNMSYSNTSVNFDNFFGTKDISLINSSSSLYFGYGTDLKVSILGFRTQQTAMFYGQLVSSNGSDINFFNSPLNFKLGYGAGFGGVELDYNILNNKVNSFSLGPFIFGNNDINLTIFSGSFLDPISHVGVNIDVSLSYRKLFTEFSKQSYEYHQSLGYTPWGKR